MPPPFKTPFSPPFSEVWPFSGRGQENLRKPPLAAEKNQKKNIFRSGGFAAAAKIIFFL
ncbi:MAG: hypothetical protein N2556_04525 [Anaerolineae bacterium]|nr:hypothetical protein [Anaerolineae bacterium]